MSHEAESHQFDGERFVTGLAHALPEAFDNVDLREEYWANALPLIMRGRWTGQDGWLVTIALCAAVEWIGGEALDVDYPRLARPARVREGRAGPLRRFFAFIEDVLESMPREHWGWIEVELFESQPWAEDIIEYLGPRTVEALRDAQSQPSFARPVGRRE